MGVWRSYDAVKITQNVFEYVADARDHPPKEQPVKESKRPELIDQRLVKALAHPLRIQILDILTERVASPNGI